MQKTLKNDWNPGIWVLIWKYSARAYQWIPTWQGWYGFQKYLRPGALDKRVASALDGLTCKLCIRMSDISLIYDFDCKWRNDTMPSRKGASPTSSYTLHHASHVCKNMPPSDRSANNTRGKYLAGALPVWQTSTASANLLPLRASITYTNVIDGAVRNGC